MQYVLSKRWITDKTCTPDQVTANYYTRSYACGFITYVNIIILTVRQVFLQVSPVSIIPPSLHTHLSPPLEVCDSTDQTAHYHALGSKLRALSVTRHLTGTEESIIIIIIIIISCHRFSFFPGTSPLEPVVNPTTQASSLSL
jgi:hypothetical protein